MIRDRRLVRGALAGTEHGAFVVASLILALAAALAAARAGVACDAGTARIDYGTNGFAFVTNLEKPAKGVVGEYAVLELKAPVTVAANATTLGAWVKGNSGWGQFYWVVELPDGKRAISGGWMGESRDRCGNSSKRSAKDGSVDRWW